MRKDLQDKLFEQYPKIFADKLADFCKQNGLNDSYGVDVGQVTEKGKTLYHVTFCKARVLVGVIKVYSPTFVLVKWMTQFRDMPHKGQEVFKSQSAAEQLIKTSFVR